MKDIRESQPGARDAAAASLVHQFEEAWKQALLAGPPPQLASYLQRLTPEDRAGLQQELERLDQAYRDLVASRQTSAPEPETRFISDSSPTATRAGDATLESGSRSIEEPADSAGVRDWPQIPGYEIVGEIGRGGMGVVYKARQRGLNRWTALKMVLAGAHAGPQQVARFHTEAKAVALLQHPNIVQIYDVGEHGGLPYFSLEYVDGGTLFKKVHRQPQPPHQAAHLIEMLAEAMDYAHQHGVIHRDLKPGNVLLTIDGQPKITDFGLAKLLEGDSSQTRTGTIVGTPSYMAPEQARGQTHEIGPRADVYALGAMLYELLTGQPPFLAATPMETMLQVTHNEPMPPSRLTPKLPPDLETICLKCLQKESHKRYASAGALAADLRRFLIGEPIVARPVGSGERAWRWCRRNPKVAVLSAAVFVLLLAITVMSVASNLQLKKQQAETERQFERAENNAALEREARRLADQKRDEALKAEGRAADNAAIAGEQRTLALNTLYGLVTKVEDKLRDKENMNDLRQDILKTALEGLGKVSKSVETAPIVDRSMGVALQRMGDNYEQMGQTEEAVRLYRSSLEIFRRLQPEQPRNDWIPWNQAVSYDKLGGLSHDFYGDAVAALDYYQKSLAIRQTLVAKPNPVTPDIPAARRRTALIVSYIKLAELARQVGDPAKSADYARESLKECAALVAATPQDAGVRRFQSVSCYMLGRASTHLRVPDEARKLLGQSIELREKAVRSDAASAAAKRELGAAYEALGDLETEQRNGKSAVDLYGKSIDLYERLNKKERNNAEDEWYLGNGYYRRGRALLLVGDAAASAKDFSESLKFHELLAKTDPKNVQFRSELMLVQARVGRHAEAARTADELRKRALKDPSLLFIIACTYALCMDAVAADKTTLSAERDRLQHHYADAALESLNRAVELGYRDTETLEREPDLAPLRKTAGFQKIVAKAGRGSTSRAASAR
jgi:serine/threonine-protein kinase